MAYIIEDRVTESSTTTGTGAFTLAGALAGFRAFSAVCATNDVVPYSIWGVDSNGNATGEWETGIGTYSSANTLTRTSVVESSNGGAAVNFSSGTKYVALAPIASQIIQKDDNGGLINFESFIRLDADRTMTSNTSAQAIFNSPTNGRLTLPVGTFLIEGLIYVNTMSATSGNAAFGLLGAGTATLANQLFHTFGVDGAAATAATVTGSTTQGSNTTAASAVSAGTGTAMTINVRGSFEVSAAGTIIPSLTLVTANAAVIKAGSYLSIRKLGSTSLVSIGAWD